MASATNVLKLKANEVVLDIETTGLDPFADRVVAIGLLTEKGEKIILKEDEKQMLEEFLKLAYDFETIIGWNVIRFDLWFLKIRCLKHNLSIENLKTSRGYVIDLMNQLFPQDQKWKRLSDVTEAFFGERKDRSGQAIQEAFLNRDFKKIEEYLREDLKLTNMLFNRTLDCHLINI